MSAVVLVLLVASCTSDSDDSAVEVDDTESTEAPVEQVSPSATDAPASSESADAEPISTQPTSSESTSTEPASTEPSAPLSDTESADTASSDDAGGTTTEPVESQVCVSMQISFDEGAPRDRFSIVNQPDSADVESVVLDLTGSVGMLVFDTLPGGDGVEVFQDFVDEGGGAELASAPILADGDESLTLTFARFAPGAAFEFSLDVDDRLTDSELGQIQVADGEIEGAELIVTAADGTTRNGAFGADSTATITC